jgi:chromosome segregation ATPase
MQNSLLEKQEQEREIDGRIATKREEEEILTRQVQEAAESLTDLRQRIIETDPDYVFVKQEYRDSVAFYEGRTIELQEDIEAKEGELRALSGRLGAVRTELDALKDEKTTLIQEIGEKRAEIGTVTEELNEVKRELEQVKDDRRETISDLDEKIRLGKRELTFVIADATARKAIIEREERLHGIRRHDLEIYEMRLRKQYPEAIIKLPDEIPAHEDKLADQTES